MSDYYNVAQPANQMLNQLGISFNNHNSTFDPKNQPLQIGHQFNRSKKNVNKYVEQDQRQDANQDTQIPLHLNTKSTVVTNNINETKQKKGRKKQSKKGLKKGTKKPNKQQQKNQKEQLNMDYDVNEIHEWKYKGTNVDRDQNSEDFDSDNEQNRQENNQQKQAIKKRLQEKLKKYQNPGTSASQPKSTTNTLKNKALQLKNKKQQQQKMEAQKQNNKHDQSSQQLFLNKSKVNQVQEKVPRKQQEEESQDPWEKVNQKTLAQKQQNQNLLRNVQNVDLNKYYQSANLPNDYQLQEEEQPSTGFLQSLCSCFKPKKKSISDVQKQLVKISKIQLTNKPEEIQLLKQIWNKLTNKKFLRYGQHWSQVGFQGRDPSTDLRSTGILSLLQWYNFLNFDTAYGMKVHNICVQFEIPLALTHIKITSLVCSSIKRRLLQGKKWEDFQQWYNAFVYFTFQYIIQNRKDLQQIGQLVQKSIQRTKNNIQNAKKYYNNQIKSKR